MHPAARRRIARCILLFVQLVSHLLFHLLSGAAASVSGHNVNKSSAKDNAAHCADNVAVVFKRAAQIFFGYAGQWLSIHRG